MIKKKLKKRKKKTRAPQKRFFATLLATQLYLCTLAQKCFATQSRIFTSTAYKSTIWQHTQLLPSSDCSQKLPVFHLLIQYNTI